MVRKREREREEEESLERYKRRKLPCRAIKITSIILMIEERKTYLRMDKSERDLIFESALFLKFKSLIILIHPHYSLYFDGFSIWKHVSGRVTRTAVAGQTSLHKRISKKKIVLIYFNQTQSNPFKRIYHPSPSAATATGAASTGAAAATGAGAAATGAGISVAPLACSDTGIPAEAREEGESSLGSTTEGKKEKESVG